MVKGYVAVCRGAMEIAAGCRGAMGIAGWLWRVEAQAKCWSPSARTSRTPLCTSTATSAGDSETLLNNIEAVIQQNQHFSDRFLPVVSTRQSPPKFPLHPYTQFHFRSAGGVRAACATGTSWSGGSVRRAASSARRRNILRIASRLSRWCRATSGDRIAANGEFES